MYLTTSLLQRFEGGQMRRISGKTNLGNELVGSPPPRSEFHKSDPQNTGNFLVTDSVWHIIIIDIIETKSHLCIFIKAIHLYY